MALTRREFVLRTAAAGAGAAAQLQNVVLAQAPSSTTASSTTTTPVLPSGAVALTWLEGHPPAAPLGVTWGVPWPRGACAKDQTFALAGASA